MQGRTKQIIGSVLGCLLGLALAVGGLGMKAEGQGAEAEVAIPAEQVIASIKTAVAAKPGNVRAVQVENEGGKTLCEVKIVALDVKTYEVEVDVATNTVVKVDDDNDENEDDKN
jgi:uncharacterized membrane protein YkoI